MLTRVFLCIVLLNFLFQSNITCMANEDEQESKLRIRRGLYQEYQNFKKFFDKISSFFSLRNPRFEERKKKLKAAFEAFRDKLTEKSVIKKDILLKMTTKKPDTTVVSEPDTTPLYEFERRFSGKPSLNSEQMIVAHGYVPETHTVLTEDGYILTMQRILPKLSNDVNKRKRVILLHHGLFGSSKDWLLIGQHKALPYLLTDSGFDVWLLNARGNIYSRSHTAKNVQNRDFWDFSFHEIAIFDLPAVITYVNEVTDKAEINYIGHSLGSTVLLVLLSSLPEYNFKLNSGILMAPLAFMYHTRGPIKLLSEYYTKNGRNSLNVLGETEFLTNRSFPKLLVDRYCEGPLSSCSNPLILLCNGGRKTVSDSLMETILKHVPGGGSIKTLIHYVQLVKSGYFRTFDYGSDNNSVMYGNTTAPIYDMNQVTLPIALFSSPSDWLATESDIETLIPLLQDVTVHHVVRAGHFGHLDFLWSPNAPELVYDFVLTILNKMLPQPGVFLQNRQFK